MSTEARLARLERLLRRLIVQHQEAGLALLALRNLRAGFSAKARKQCEDDVLCLLIQQSQELYALAEVTELTLAPEPVDRNG